jgi:hypothetical protein
MLSTLVSGWQRTEVDGEASWKPFAHIQGTIGIDDDDATRYCTKTAVSSMKLDGQEPELTGIYLCPTKSEIRITPHIGPAIYYGGLRFILQRCEYIDYAAPNDRTDE